MSLPTQLVHADDKNNRVPDIVTPINVSTTFRYDNNDLIPWAEREDYSFMDERPIYSRLAHPNATRVESVLSEVLHAETVVYSSGCSAYFALLTHFNPKRVFMGQCYHGCRSIANIFTRNWKLEQHPLEIDVILELAQEGDIVHLESPVNPYGTSFDIQAFADATHSKGALLVIDSTFAPPPLQDAWEFGADVIMHSATKYFGGHSDLLAGAIAVKDKAIAEKLRDDRCYLGTNIANLEAFLLLRSLRTFEMRIKTQSENTFKIVEHLDATKTYYPDVLDGIYHSSLQDDPFVKRQLKGGFGPVFAIRLKTKDQCKRFPQLLKYFHHATSLGGIESLVEWRALTDPHIEQTLIRISVGVEAANDLIDDLSKALQYLQDVEQS